MNRQIAFLFFVAMCLCQCATSFAAPLADKSQEDAITEISLERTVDQWEQRPFDRITLRADGTAVYVGVRNVERIGRFRGVIPKHNFNFLAGFLTEQKFFELKDNSIYLADVPISSITVVKGSKRHGVNNYGNYGLGYPLTVWGIEMAIRGVVADIKWEKVDLHKEIPKNKSVLRGVAMAGPIHSADREGETTETALAQSLITIQPEGGGKEIVRVRADADGRFELILDPGKYLLVPLSPMSGWTAPEERQPEDELLPPRGKPQTITIEPGKVTEVVVHYDIGIR